MRLAALALPLAPSGVRPEHIAPAAAHFRKPRRPIPLSLYLMHTRFSLVQEL
jgi:hypothetical protein